VAGLVWRYGGVAVCRRALVVCGVLVDGAEGQQRGRLDGTGGKVSRHASEVLMAGSEQACATLCCSARRSSAGVKEEREKTEREER
jgi:hypothetical protein